MERVRVVIADDHPVFRDGIARAVRERPDLELVGAASGGREALDLLREHRPLVAVVDLRMPDVDGLQVVQAVQREELGTRVLLLSASTEGAVALTGIEAGAAGYLTKDRDREAICDAVQAIARGESVLDPALQGAVLGEIRQRGAAAGGPKLTPREREVLVLIATGLTAPAIAQRLVVSVPTVKTHLASLYDKLGVSDRAAAVAEGMRRGLLE
jgi:two-component system, NarL family, nitrate/nitrite response regulator NarL